jgi:hypothetical protein
MQPNLMKSNEDDDDTHTPPIHPADTRAHFNFHQKLTRVPTTTLETQTIDHTFDSPH